jgi:nanoRNase/pAp phosphatase (c-di-AMP/oligoRNAs hydrolase)
MNDPKVKQQIAEKIKDSSNILVTVSTNPSVDALSAALGLTIMLNKLGKHATAVFSGSIPPAITFLDPEKTFEDTVDSLRDFIIALDKEKADHLRYKVDGDVVKIFITPYRTTITSEDLEFSQGDYNVELVLALGVDNQEHLDSALEAHGRILHDATVATITAGELTSELGSLAWHDEKASSLSEMLVSLSDAIKDDKPLLDEEIATALLTGIVAATDRFSNPRTTSTVMTMAAQLMAAGADQQLIAAKLKEGHEVQPEDKSDAIPQGSSVKIEDKSAKKTVNGELSIEHLQGETLEEIAQEVEANHQKEAAVEAEHVLAEQEKPTDNSGANEPQAPSGAVSWTPGSGISEPSFGSALNATTEQAAEDTRQQIEDDQNKTILTHAYLGGSQSSAPLINDSQGTDTDESANDVDIFANNPDSETSEPVSPAIAPEAALDSIITPTTTPPTQTLADLDAQTRDHDDARAAVEQALGTQTVDPAAAIPPVMPPVPVTPFDLPSPPPLPDFSQLPPIQPTSAYALDPADMPAPERLGDILAPEAPQAAPVSEVPVVPPVATPPNDPGQFHIPGQ